MTTGTMDRITLVNAVPGKGDGWVRQAALVLAGTMLLYISAKFKVPIGPVPFTMQTFVVLIIGMAYGWRLGALTMLAYLAEGAVGLPVFADTPEKGIGLAYMMGPTGGYLVGFVLAAAATGYLAERGWDRTILLTAFAMFIGNALIYVLGVGWLTSLIGFEKAVTFGFKPFLVGDLIKLILAALALPLAWKLVRR